MSDLAYILPSMGGEISRSYGHTDRSRHRRFQPENAFQAGYLPWRLQRGERLSMPESRPKVSVHAATSCAPTNYRIDPDSAVVLEVLKKKTPATPKSVVDVCRRRLTDYDQTD
jgi:hypothetical protein